MANMSLQKHPMPEQDPAVRAGNFKEVALGYTKEIAMEEADRCLTQGTLEPVKSCSGNIRISRQYMLQEKDWQLESPTQER